MDTTYIIIKQQINESDGRIQGRSGATGASDFGPGGQPNRYDWRLWTASGYGRRLQSYLQGGNGYSYEVTDMGKYVVVHATFHNLATGKTVSKTFVIAFDNPKIGDGKVFATSTKWRTVSNVDQAANYIKSTIQSMS